MGLTSCQKPQNTNTLSIDSTEVQKISWEDITDPFASVNVQVLNHLNQPLENAEILVGMKLGSPFKNNFVKTNKNGVATLPQWTGLEPITVNASGYIRQTFLNQKPGQFKIKMNPLYKQPRYVVKGQVTQLPVSNGDKFIDFGLVIPTLNRFDLLSFDIDQIISPYNDTISVVGNEISLPSNVSLPTQKENYFLPITLSKPQYRVYTPYSGSKTYYALSGRFPFKTVVDEFQNDKKFFEVLNYFSFTNGSLRDLNITAQESTLDIPGLELNFTQQVKIKGTRVLNDEALLAVSMNDLSGRFVPSDVKRIIENQEQNLKIMAGKPTTIVSILRKQADFDSATKDKASRTSITINDFKVNYSPDMLPLIEAPVVNQSGQQISLTLNPPNTILNSGTQVNPVAFTVSISKIKEEQNNNEVVELLDREWEVLGFVKNSWPKSIILPEWPKSGLSEEMNNQKRKFEINLIGSDSTQQVNSIDELAQKTSHITHSAAEL